MKCCFKCGAEKPLSEFYKHPKMADGHVNKCKECNKRDVRENRLSNKDYYDEYDRNRPNHVERVKAGNERTKRLYATDETFRSKIQKSKIDWAQRNPHKRKAQNALSNAVRDGDVLKLEFCEHCFSSDKKIQGHHWSYLEEHWLDVIWLCTKCHGLEHKRLKALGRDPDKL